MTGFLTQLPSPNRFVHQKLSSVAKSPLCPSPSANMSALEQMAHYAAHLPRGGAIMAARLCCLPKAAASCVVGLGAASANQGGTRPLTRLRADICNRDMLKQDGALGLLVKHAAVGLGTAVGRYFGAPEKGARASEAVANLFNGTARFFLTTVPHAVLVGAGAAAMGAVALGVAVGLAFVAGGMTSLAAVVRPTLADASLAASQPPPDQGAGAAPRPAAPVAAAAAPVAAAAAPVAPRPAPVAAAAPVAPRPAPVAPPPAAAAPVASRPAPVAQPTAAPAAFRIDAELAPVPARDALLSHSALSPAARQLVDKTMRLREFVEGESEFKATAEALEVTIDMSKDGLHHHFVPTEVAASRAKVSIIGDGDHYDALLPEGDRFVRRPALSRGDCFYGAVAAGSNYRRFGEMLTAHRNDDVPAMRAIYAAEYPAEYEQLAPTLQGRSASDQDSDLFNGFGDLMVKELRHRVGAALVASAVRDAADPTKAELQDAVAEALAMGDPNDLLESQENTLRTARFLANSGAHLGTVKQAGECLLHTTWLLEGHYKEADPNDGRGIRARLLSDRTQLEELLKKASPHLSAAKRQEVCDEMEALHPQRPLPSFLSQVLA